jgi:ribonuclease E
MRLWETIRETDLRSIAPALIYEEGDLIKRSIRDLYDKRHRRGSGRGRGWLPAAKDFMKHAHAEPRQEGQAYREPIPLFHRYGSRSSSTRCIRRPCS